MRRIGLAVVLALSFVLALVLLKAAKTFFAVLALIRIRASTAHGIYS
jgi:hypothetical protein